MLCEICKQNEATVFITKIINESKQELRICEKCAKESEGLNISGDMTFSTPFSFQNILSGLMDYISQSQPTQEHKIADPVCSNCGTTYSDFKKSGLLGCSNCYKQFNSTLKPVIKRVQGNTEHVGKIPQKSGKDILERRKLNKLKEELQKAIASEEYENAAKIRDMIRQLQNEEDLNK